MVSAFSFESANHMLIRTVKGTLKNPEKIVEKFLSKQSMQDETKTVNCALYIKLSSESYQFAIENSLTEIRGRFFGEILYTSSSFTYTKNNISNCVAQTSASKFVKIEYFADQVGVCVAIVRFFKSKKVISYSAELDDTFCFHYKIGKPGELKIIDVKDLRYKCVLLDVGNNIFSASVMREGFEHN